MIAVLQICGSSFWMYKLLAH